MIDLKLGDAFKLIPLIKDSSIDLILTDPPYDAAEIYMPRLTDMQKREMAKQYWRVLKPTGNLATFCGYTDKYKWYQILNKNFRYMRELIWVYKNPSHGKMRVVKQARKFIIAHESILWFAKSEKTHYFNNEGTVELTWFMHPAYSGLRRSAEHNPHFQFPLNGISL